MTLFTQAYDNHVGRIFGSNLEDNYSVYMLLPKADSIGFILNCVDYCCDYVIYYCLLFKVYGLQMFTWRGFRCILLLMHLV